MRVTTSAALAAAWFNGFTPPVTAYHVPPSAGNDSADINTRLKRYLIGYYGASDNSDLTTLIVLYLAELTGDYNNRSIKWCVMPQPNIVEVEYEDRLVDVEEEDRSVDVEFEDRLVGIEEED